MRGAAGGERPVMEEQAHLDIARKIYQLRTKAKLSQAELAFARTRPRPAQSIATRAAAHAALAALGVSGGSAVVEGGGQEPPRLEGLPGGFVSLSHEDELVAALVAIGERDPCG